MLKQHSRKTLLMALLLGLVLLLAACAPAQNTQEPKPTDSAAVVESAAEETAEVLEETAEVLEETAEVLEEAGEDLAQAAGSVASGLSALVADVTARLDTASPALLLSLEELAAFDGREGRPALVAVDNVIYDVTKSALWKDGGHNGFAAGQDLTDAIKSQSPHGPGKMENVPAVGRVKLVLTLAELATFNGKDGKPAYVAVDGIVYDVSQSSLWKNGQHNGFEAGNDLTDAIKQQSPHGVGKLDNVVEIGVLIGQ